DNLTTELQGSGAFFRRHGRLHDEIAGSWTNLCVDEARMCTALAGYTGVHYPKFDALQLRQYADRRAAVQKIAHHLGGHFARICANPMFRRSVIGGEDDA